MDEQTFKKEIWEKFGKELEEFGPEFTLVASSCIPATGIGLNTSKWPISSG